MDLEKDFQPETQPNTVLILYAQKVINVFVSAALLCLSKAFDSIKDKILDKKLEMIGFNISSRLKSKNFLSHCRAASNYYKTLY